MTYHLAATLHAQISIGEKVDKLSANRSVTQIVHVAEERERWNLLQQYMNRWTGGPGKEGGVRIMLFMLYKKWQSSQPWPDFGGKITKIHSTAEWDELLASSKGPVIVDAYALWCGPCKTVAPIFAKMSEQFEDVTFAKFDVDEVSDLARRLEISAMPTFKIFKAGKEVEVQRGFPGEGKIRELIMKHGAKPGGKAD